MMKVRSRTKSAFLRETIISKKLQQAQQQFMKTGTHRRNHFVLSTKITRKNAPFVLLTSMLLLPLFFIIIISLSSVTKSFEMMMMIRNHGKVGDIKRCFQKTVSHQQLRLSPTPFFPTQSFGSFRTTSIGLSSSTSETTTTTRTKTATTTTTDDSHTVSSTSIYAQEAEALQKLQSSFLITLRDRGFLHQCTNIMGLDELLSSKTIRAAYLGFDATADSLHVGSLLQIMILRHYQKSGHKPIVLIGGGTSKVGDPTGKDISRQLLSDDIIQSNMNGISKVFQKFLQFEDTFDPNTTHAIMVNNDNWLKEIKYLTFLREFGTLFTINRMLSFESVKQRLEREAPFTFLEFNYMILQAYDFIELYKQYHCILQLGGSDQWGNMIAGTELGKRVFPSTDVNLYALTAPLITTADGKKMGKTANGAVWLNVEKLSTYDYWQFWRNTADQDVIRFLKLFTELPLDTIHSYEVYVGTKEINDVKIILADEATKLLHGEECLPQIHETVASMFTDSSSTASTDGLPIVYVTSSELTNGVRIIDVLVQLKLASSKKDARRLIQGGGARMVRCNYGNEESIIDDENVVLTITDFIKKNDDKDNENDAGSNDTKVILRAGKKRAGVVEYVME